MFLAFFDEAREDRVVEAVTLDLAKATHISSADICSIMRMVKALGDPSRMGLDCRCDEVHEVLVMSVRV